MIHAIIVTVIIVTAIITNIIAIIIRIMPIITIIIPWNSQKVSPSPESPLESSDFAELLLP